MCACVIYHKLLSKFTDGTMIGRIIRSDSDATDLQTDLHRMNKWAERWQMEFNTSQTNIVSVERSIVKTLSYRMTY